MEFLARKTQINHPLGDVDLETPLLVPSFSSKGFGFSKSGKSGIKDIFDIAIEYLTDTMLISAYDLANNYLLPIEQTITDLTFVDSGGYEISNLHDLSAVFRYPLKIQDWSIDKLSDVYSKWPSHIPAVFVNYDHPDIRITLEKQIESAKSFLEPFKKQLHTLLIKPETKTADNIKVNNVIAICGEFKYFDIIGFTEKELGNSIIERMLSIAKIRIAMDDQNIQKPIHIYGSLDPITSILYFLSGAEIFDGLTWLRYGYIKDFACYWNNYGAKVIGIHRKDDFYKGKIIQDNLSFLVDLNNQMNKFLLEHDYNSFKYDPNFFKDSYDLLRTKNKRI